MGVPGDHLVFGDLDFGQAGAGVEGPPVADRVLQPGQEPVGQLAGLERLAVLTAVDRPPDPEPCPGAAAELLDVPEPDVVAVHLLSAPACLACPVLPGGAATPSARCAGPAPRRPAAAPAARLPAGASGRTPPATPATRRSPHQSSAADHPRYRVLRPGWRRAGRERLAFPGPARPWARDDGRSAPPAASSPAPARTATADGGRGSGETGKKAGPRRRERTVWRAAWSCRTGRPAGPGAGPRAVADATLPPAADRRGGLASRPGPQASTRTSARQVKSAPPQAGTGLTPGPSHGSIRPVPAPHEQGNGPRGRAGHGPGTAKGHGGACP
jgi:translation initiation factor IF-2